MFLYADDVLLLHPINSSQDMVQVQSDLDLLNNWLILPLTHLSLNTFSSLLRLRPLLTHSVLRISQTLH